MPVSLQQSYILGDGMRWRSWSLLRLQTGDAGTSGCRWEEKSSGSARLCHQCLRTSKPRLSHWRSVGVHLFGYEVKLQRFTWEINHTGFMSETCPPLLVWSTQNRAELFRISNGHYSQLELNDKLLKCSQNTHTPRLGANVFLRSWVSKLFIWLREISFQIYSYRMWLQLISSEFTIQVLAFIIPSPSITSVYISNPCIRCTNYPRPLYMALQFSILLCNTKGDIVSFYLEVVPGYDLWLCQVLKIFVQVEANLKLNHWTIWLENNGDFQHEYSKVYFAFISEMVWRLRSSASKLTLI